jgi:hypothetical protein
MPKELETMLARLDFVNFDRFTCPLVDHEYHVYGWIDREKDAYKDFLVLSYVDGDFWFITSSAQHSDRIAEIINGEEIEDAPTRHYPCQRVESVTKIKNAIRL